MGREDRGLPHDLLCRWREVSWGHSPGDGKPVSLTTGHGLGQGYGRS